jgi:hypothetical protein
MTMIYNPPLRLILRPGQCLAGVHRSSYPGGYKPNMSELRQRNWRATVSRPASVTPREFKPRCFAVLSLSAVLLAASAIGSGSAAIAAAIPPSMAPLVEQKKTIAAELARQVATCSARHDTDHPAFKGCIDWHSAVHGVWALTAYERATGDRQYSPLVASILNADALERERQHLRQSPQFEMPYGRAWFLRLAIEHRRLTGADDLTDFADEVALSIRDHYRARAIDRFSGAYDSASWALINLLDYARFRNRSDVEAEVTDWVKRDFVGVDLKCGYDRERGEFMAICTNWAALVSRVLDGGDYSVWLDKFIATNGLPRPVTDPSTNHDFGLNFSRAWGLWDMVDKSGRADVAEAYVAHFHNGLVPASNWSGSYEAVGHWVAQFGMFAIQPLFGPDLGR